MYGTDGKVSFKIPAKSKQKEWIKEVVHYAGNNLSMYSSEDIRASVRDKLINFDLYEGVIHISDFVNLVNPLDLQTIDNTREIKHYPIAAPIFDLLNGEEIDRPYEPLVKVTNNVAIADKQARKKEYISNKLKELEDTFQGGEEELKVEMEKFQRKLKYTYKDLKEFKASSLLSEYYDKDNFKEIFTEGFRRMWNTADEVYEIDIVHNEPTLRAVDTTKLRTSGGANTSKIEDSDIIAIEDHFSAGTLIDMYGDELTADDMERILSLNVGNLYGYSDHGNVTHEFRPVGDILGNEFGMNYINSDGAIRHMRIRWKGYMKLKRVKYQDPNDGTEQIKTRFSNYKLKEGEFLDSTLWAYQWWIATLIGSDIIVGAKPNGITYNRLSSFSEGHPGVVGDVYNINNRKAVPPMTKMRSHQYLYDVVMDNVIVAMSKNVGPILEMDMAKKPASWDVAKWLQYMYKYNTKFIDSFKEVKKGVGKGQLAGNLASGRDQIQQLDFGNYIQQLINLAEYLETAAANTIGVTPQRKGAIQNRESVGGVERATSQSSHITEW